MTSETDKPLPSTARELQRMIGDGAGINRAVRA